jgi:hypothetical protein
MDSPNTPAERAPDELHRDADRARDNRDWALAELLYAGFPQHRAEAWGIRVQPGHCRKERGDTAGALALFRVLVARRQERLDWAEVNPAQFRAPLDLSASGADAEEPEWLAALQAMAVALQCARPHALSEYEGWGLPVTESLAHGKVPLIPEHSALPEAGAPGAQGSTRPNAAAALAWAMREGSNWHQPEPWGVRSTGGGAAPRLPLPPALRGEG